jgi:sugar lactone lactonase YvrE
MLEEATRQRSLAHHYADAIKALESQAWAEAIEHLRAVVAVDAGYRDAAARLEEAERQQTLADLYARARRLHQAQEWQAVINVFERIAALDAAYPDPDGLLASARQELETQRQEEHKAALYGQALRAMKAGEWPQAEAHFEEIRRQDPGYRDTEVLLARARQALAAHKAAEEAQAEEERRRARIADLERGAQEALASEDWTTAIARLQALLEVDPAHAEASADLSRARQQQELATLYASGRKHVEARRWREALDDFRRLREIGGAYKDVGALSAEAERGLARKEAVPLLPAPSGETSHSPRRLPSLRSKKLPLAIGLLGVVLLGILLVSRSGSRGHTDQVNSAAFSPDGTRVVTASDDRTARIWEARTGRELSALRGQGLFVHSAAFSRDGRYVLTAGSGGARVWEADTGTPVQELRSTLAQSAAFSPDERYIVTAGSDETARLWEVGTGNLVREFRGHTGSVRSAAFSPDGKYLVTAGWDGTARLWDAGDGRLVRELPGHAAHVNSAVFSPDGRYVATASSGGVRLWEADTGAIMRELPSSYSESVAFSPDGQYVVTAGVGAPKLWEVGVGNLVRELPGHTAWVRSAAFSPDGARVVTASDDKTARIWEASTGRELVRLGGGLFPWPQ